MNNLDKILNQAVEGGFEYVIVFKIDGEIGVAIGFNAFHPKINVALNQYIELMKNVGVKYEVEFYNVKGTKVKFQDIPMVFSIEEDNTPHRKGAYM